MYVSEYSDYQLQQMSVRDLRTLDVKDDNDEERLQRFINGQYDPDIQNRYQQEEEIRYNILRKYGVDNTDPANYAATFEDPLTEEQASAEIDAEIAKFREAEKQRARQEEAVEVENYSWEEKRNELKQRVDELSQYIDEDVADDLKTKYNAFKMVTVNPNSKDATKYTKQRELEEKLAEVEQQREQVVNELTQAA